MAKCVSSRMLATLLLIAVIFGITGHYTVEYANANTHHMKTVRSPLVGTASARPRSR